MVFTQCVNTAFNCCSHSVNTGGNHCSHVKMSVPDAISSVDGKKFDSTQCSGSHNWSESEKKSRWTRFLQLKIDFKGPKNEREKSG